MRWPILSLAWWFSVTPGLRPSPPYPRKPTRRSPPPGATLTLFGAPAGRSVFSLPAGPDANVEKDGSSASLTAMSDSPGGCLWAGWGTRRQELGGHSRPPLRRVPPVLDPPCDPHYTYLINVGAQKVLGSPKQGGTRTPKSTKRKKTETKPNPKPQIARDPSSLD